MVRNWRLTSSTIDWAALPTAPIVSPQKRKAAMPPINAPTSTFGFIRFTWKKSMNCPISAFAGSKILPSESIYCVPCSIALCMAILISST